MNWFRSSKKQNETHINTAAGERLENLYWTALIITGNEESARESIIDAGALVQTDSFEFRDWLVRWGSWATARAAVNRVRSSIHKTAAQSPAWACNHRTHKALLPEEVQELRAHHANRLIEQLDVLARAVLVLYGCHQASLSECSLLLDVPLSATNGAYCRALQWYHEVLERPHEISQYEPSRLYLVRYDSDGVPIWDAACPPA